MYLHKWEKRYHNYFFHCGDKFFGWYEFQHLWTVCPYCERKLWSNKNE